MGLWGRMCHGGIVYITVICDLIGKKNRTLPTRKSEESY